MGWKNSTLASFPILKVSQFSITLSDDWFIVRLLLSWEILAFPTATVPPVGRVSLCISWADKFDKNIDVEIRQRRDYIIVNVIDNGIGFKNKKTKELIKPYFTTKEKGTGLGLSIVDKIISDHNGSIQFLNHKNGAATIPLLGKTKSTDAK